MLVTSAQNQSISSEICPENSHEIGRFYLVFFGEVSPENFAKFPRYQPMFLRISLKIPRNLTFFSATDQMPLSCCLTQKSKNILNFVTESA